LSKLKEQKNAEPMEYPQCGRVFRPTGSEFVVKLILADIGRRKNCGKVGFAEGLFDLRK